MNAGISMLAYIKEKAICSLHFMFCLPSSLFFSELVYFIGLPFFFFWQRDKSRSNKENLNVLQSSQRILVCYQTSGRYRASMGLGTFWLVKVISVQHQAKCYLATDLVLDECTGKALIKISIIGLLSAYFVPGTV